MYVPNNITAKYVKQTNKSEWREKTNLNYSWKLQLLFFFSTPLSTRDRKATYEVSKETKNLKSTNYYNLPSLK